MTITDFHNLLRLVGPHLQKFSNREPISPEHRLIITLRYLATGDSPFSISIHYLIGESTCYAIIKETCAIIANILAPTYLACPTIDEWHAIARGFEEVWNMPNCVGAVDGRHMKIRAPPNSGTLFFNYKKTFSTVLLAACNHEYEFTLVDVGAYGSESDGGILNRSAFGQALFKEDLNLPTQTFALRNSNASTPHYFVGDEAFAISPRMMRPFPAQSLNLSRRVFNYRLSRARRIIENTFGILVARWRILQTTMGLNVTNVDRIVMATVCLHNYMMVENKRNKIKNNLYCPPSFIDRQDPTGNIIEGSWRFENCDDLPSISSMSTANATSKGYEIRDILENYFMSEEGQVPWQFDYLSRSQYGDDFTPY